MKLILALLILTLHAQAHVTARVVSVYDGDTFTVEAAIWPGLKWHGSIRVAGVDTPEIQGRCELERNLAQEARSFVRGRIGESVTLADVTQGTFAGRVVASVRLADGTDLKTALIVTGHGPGQNLFAIIGYLQKHGGLHLKLQTGMISTRWP